MSTPIEDLLATVARLWPDADDVEVVGRGATAEHLAGEVLRAAPSIDAPRLLIPEQRRAAAGAILRFSRAVTVREVVQRLTTATALRVVGPRPLLGGVAVVGGRGGITEHLSEVLGRQVVTSLGIGPKRANRKPVLQVFDVDGRPLAHVKVGDTPTAAAHVRGEADALRSVEDVRWRRVRIPRVLHHGDWEGRDVLVLSTLPVSPWQFGARRRRFPLDGALEVAQSASAGTVGLVDMPAWGRWVDTTSALTDVDHRDRLRAVLDRVVDGVGAVPLRCGAWHGDFTPWNMAWSGGLLSLWDWERYETGVPVGLDLVHHAVNVRAHGSGFTSDALRTGVEDARRMLGGRGSSDALIAAYLVAIAVRYLAAAEDDGGEVIRDSGRVALAELERYEPALTRSAA